LGSEIFGSDIANVFVTHGREPLDVKIEPTPSSTGEFGERGQVPKAIPPLGGLSQRPDQVESFGGGSYRKGLKDQDYARSMSWMNAQQRTNYVAVQVVVGPELYRHKTVPAIQKECGARIFR
jgi:hypothetical protein